MATKQGRKASGGGKYGFNEKGRWGNRGNVGGKYHGADVHNLNKSDRLGEHYTRYNSGQKEKFGALDKLYYSNTEKEAYNGKFPWKNGK